MTLIERLLAEANKEANELADLLNEAAEALAQPQQDPVGEVTDALGDAFKCEFKGPLSVGTKLYTSPPARKPLTESEIYKAINDWVGDIDPEDEPSALDIFRAAEAAHNIKENT